MATFKSLAKQMDKLNDNLPKKVNKLAKQTANDVLKLVTAPGVTKVDTSEAVSNWRIGIGSKDLSTRSPFFTGKAGSTAAASRAEVRLVGKILIESKPPQVPIHISNNVDHIDTAFVADEESIVKIVEQKLDERIERFKL